MSNVPRILVAILVALLGLPSCVSAQGRADTLLVVTELAPNSMDIHGVGANRPSYQASWNLYDRLLTYGAKTLPDGSRMYDYNVLKPELAEYEQLVEKANAGRRAHVGARARLQQIVAELMELTHQLDGINEYHQQGSRSQHKPNG